MLSDTMCYTCLSKEKQELIKLEKNCPDKVTYKQKLTSCISANLEELEEMKICRTCVKHLRISYKFLTLVKRTQESIKEFLRQGKCDTKHQKEIKLSQIKGYKNEQNSVDDLYTREDGGYFLQLDADHRTVFTCTKCNKNHMDSDEYLQHECEAKVEVDIRNEALNKELFNSQLNPAENKEQKVTKKVKTKLEKMHDCQHCGYVFKKMWQLQKHLKQVHNKERKYICSYCEKAFKQAYHLREHISMHTGERNYSCPICEKTFVRSSSQRRHMKSHDAAPGQKTKRTPFLCTICGKSFPFSNGVQRHMRVHFGIKKYECKVCKRKFMQSTHLSVHMRTHTGEKPYICDICGDAFPLNCSLQKHMNIHKVLDMKIESIIEESNEK